MEVVPGIHVIDLGMVQAYLCCEADRVTLIDAGLADSSGAILEALRHVRRLPSNLRQIVLTHWHPDHTGALSELLDRTGALAVAHEADAPVISGETAGPPPRILDVERPYFDAKPDVPPAPPARVDRHVRDGDEIDLDGVSEIVGVPGHTPGSIAIYLPRRRVLFAGDAVASMNGRPIVGVFNVDPVEARVSFAKLAALEFDVACFGHGPPLDRGACQAFRHLADRLSNSA